MPTNLEHGKAIYTSVSYNSVVSYECRYGYTLVGQPTRRCGTDKKWIDHEPYCQGQSFQIFPQKTYSYDILFTHIH